MSNIEPGTRYYHRIRKMFGEATGSVVKYNAKEYVEVVINENEYYEQCWDPDNIVKVRSDNHALELILRS